MATYPPSLMGRAADELDLLPAGSAIETLLSDCQVLRDQARACAGTRFPTGRPSLPYLSGPN